MPSGYSLGPKITLLLTTKLETPFPLNPTPYLLDVLVGCVAFLPQLRRQMTLRDSATVTA